MKNRICLILCFVHFAGLILPAQNPFIRNYTMADGLPSNTVYFLMQDTRNFIWFATDAGVARYDGTQFDYFQKKDGLSCNEVVRIQEDSFGRIWFFNMNGTVNFYYHNKIFNELNAPFLKSLKSADFFRKFFQDKDNTIYFYYNQQRDIVALDSQNKISRYIMPSKMVFDPLSQDSSEWMIIREMSKTESGEFMLWTQAGIYTLKDLGDTPKQIVSGFRIRDVFPAKKQTRYVYGYLNDLNKTVILKYANDRAIDTILSPLRINTYYKILCSILEDASGFLWISAFEEGLYCLKKKNPLIHLDLEECQALMQDNENNIWVSSLHDGVFKISPYLNLFSHYQPYESNHAGITAIARNPEGGVWCTNGDRISLFRDGTFHTMDFVNAGGPFNRIRFIRNHGLLVWQKGAPCYNFQGIRVNPMARKVFFNHYTHSLYNYKEIVSNKNESVFASFTFLALLTFSPERGPLAPDRINVPERIYNIFYNRNDELVLNSQSSYFIRKGKPHHLRELDFLANRIINDHLVLNDSVDLLNIEGDSLFMLSGSKLVNLSAYLNPPLVMRLKHMDYAGSRLYLATAQHLFFCDHPVELFSGKPVQLHPVDIMFRNIQDFLVMDDLLYLATEDGLTVIPIHMLDSVRTLFPSPYFKSVLINDIPIDPNLDKVNMKGNNRINLVFGSKCYSSGELIYSYKLEGTDQEWAIGNNVIYQNLSPGSYILKLRVRKPSSTWSEPVQMHITVRSTIWQHPIFYIFLSIFLATGIVLLIIKRKNNQLRRQEIDHQLLTLEQKALQSMMNPHFIFNALSSIQSFLLKNKSGEAGLYLSQFARLIRQNLSSINTPVISLEEEVDRLKNYLDLEQLRMAGRFEYSILIDKDVEEDELLIPSMILQPFVENAILHGISPLEEPGLIRILISQNTEKSLKVIIEDNGIGTRRSEVISERSEKHLHLGMGMTRKRLEMIGKKMQVETSVTIVEADPGNPNPGTRVILILPVS